MEELDMVVERMIKNVVVGYGLYNARYNVKEEISEDFLKRFSDLRNNISFVTGEECFICDRRMYSGVSECLYELKRVCDEFMGEEYVRD